MKAFGKCLQYFNHFRRKCRCLSMKEARRRVVLDDPFFFLILCTARYVLTACTAREWLERMWDLSTTTWIYASDGYLTAAHPGFVTQHENSELHHAAYTRAHDDRAIGSFVRNFPCFKTMPCRNVPLLVHFLLVHF